MLALWTQGWLTFPSLLPPAQLHGVKSERQLLAYTTAIATADLSLICNLHHSSGQRWIADPLSEARDQTCNLMVPSQIRFHCAMTETPDIVIYNNIYVI